MKAGFSIKLILYFAPKCPQQIVAPNCPTPNCHRRIGRAELSAPNCPAPNCPDTTCTYIHTYIQAYIHASHARTHTRAHTQAHIHTYMHACMHTHIHTFIHVHACIHTLTLATCQHKNTHKKHKYTHTHIASI